MVARPSPQVTSENWNGLWGSDARYYARRSDGTCFAIDGAVSMFDLAGSSPPASHAEPVTTMPECGRYMMRMVAARPVAERRDGAPEDAGALDVAGAGVGERQPRRLFAYGVRRAMQWTKRPV